MTEDPRLLVQSLIQPTKKTKALVGVISLAPLSFLWKQVNPQKGGEALTRAVLPETYVTSAWTSEAADEVHNYRLLKSL